MAKSKGLCSLLNVSKILVYLPVQVRLVFVYIDVVEWIHADPRVECKPILIWPFCYGGQSYCLLWENKQKKKQKASDTVMYDPNCGMK